MSINYTLTRTKRKSIMLRVKDGIVEVVAPLKCPKSEIDRFVKSKERWIAEKIALTGELKAKRSSFSVNYGSLLTLRGAKYPIKAKEGNKIGFDGGWFYLPPGLPQEEIKPACIEIYRMLAKQVLTAKTYNFAGHMAVSPSAVKITGAKKRWGSCSSKNSINFSWRLIMADDCLIDYVVVHELAHIIELNHSARFWAIVEGILPDYKERMARLDEFQIKLEGESWE